MAEQAIANIDITKTVKYNENQILNSITRSGVPGLQEELLQFPIEILRLIRSIMGVHDDSSNAFSGLKVKSFNTKINTTPGYVITPENLYRLDGLFDYTPVAGAVWGNIEIEMNTTDSESQYIPVFSTADKVVNNTLLPTKKHYKVTLYDNFSLTPLFPTVGAGRILWLQYKMTGSNITEVVNILENYSWG